MVKQAPKFKDGTKMEGVDGRCWVVKSVRKWVKDDSKGCGKKTRPAAAKKQKEEKRSNLAETIMRDLNSMDDKKISFLKYRNQPKVLDERLRKIARGYIKPALRQENENPGSGSV
jgi:microcystin degradation protein MlrC